MNDPRRETGYWPARLKALAALVDADALAVVLSLHDGGVLVYASHNLAAPSGWETRAAGGAVVRAIRERASTVATAEVELADGRAARSLCAAPIVWQESVIGAIVALRAARPWTEAETAGLERAAELAALELAETNALWRAQALSNALAARERIRADIQKELAASADPDTILDRATRRLAEIFSADGVSVMLVAPSGELVTRAAVGMREDLVKDARRKVGEGIAGWVAQAGQPLLLSGKVDDARFAGVDPSIGGALVAPLRSEDRILGVVNVKARGADKYGESQLADLATVAQDVAVALERADQTQRLEEDRRQALVLYELSRLVLQGGNPSADLETASMMLADTLHHDVLGVWITEGDDTRLRLRASRGYGETPPPDVLVAGDAALQGALGERRPQRVVLDGFRPAWASGLAISYILAPICAGPHPIGVLIAGRAQDTYSDSDVDFTQTVGDYLAGLVQRTASSEEQGAASNERRRIAQELHDGLAQELTGVVLALEGCQRALERDPNVLPTQLAKAARDARACLADIRQYMTALRQRDAGAMTLPVTVSRLVEDLRRTSGLTVELEEIGAERQLPAAVERAIVRMAQEALHNVAQHAQASRAKVILRYDEEEVTLTVEDDGEGFAVDQTIASAEQRGRFGILGMRERAEGVGGRLAIRSEPSQGTIVQARVPYQSGPKLAVVPPWPGAATAEPGEEARAQTVEDIDEVDHRRGGFLSRLFGRP